jgi:plasmid stabilization system protein ParE
MRKLRVPCVGNGCAAPARSLDVFSERGRIVPELNQPNVRQLLVQRYRLLYEVTPAEVQVLAFVHGARDLTGSGFEG